MQGEWINQYLLSSCCSLVFLLAVGCCGSQNRHPVPQVSGLTRYARLLPSSTLFLGQPGDSPTGCPSPGSPHLSFPGQVLLAKLVLVLLVNPRASSESSGSRNYLCWLLGGTQQALTWRKALDCGCCSNSLSLSPTHLTPRHELNCELNSILLLMARGVPAWEYLKWKQAPSSLTHGNRDLVVTADSRSLLWSVN